MLSDFMTLCWGMQYLTTHLDDDSSLDGARWLSAIAQELNNQLTDEDGVEELLPYLIKLKELSKELKANERFLQPLRKNLKELFRQIDDLAPDMHAQEKPLLTTEKRQPSVTVKRGRPAAIYLKSAPQVQERKDIVRKVLVGLFDEQAQRFMLDGATIAGSHLAALLFNIGIEQDWACDGCTMGSFYNLLEEIMQSDKERVVLRHMDQTGARNLVKNWKEDYFTHSFTGKRTLLSACSKTIDEKYKNSSFYARQMKEKLDEEKIKRGKLVNYMIDRGFIHPIIPDN